MFISTLIILFININFVIACPTTCQCFMNVVYCRSFADNIPNNTKVLTIRDVNKLTKSIHKDYFVNLQNLEYLTIINASKIPGELFTRQHKLKELQITGSMLKEINRKLFIGLKNLRKLSMFANKKLSIISPLAFKGLNLTELILHSNNINNISSNAFNGLNYLQNLKLKSNNIEFIPTGMFQNLSMLQAVNLDNNKISTIYETTFLGLSNLKYLFLRNNKISSVFPGSFKTMKNLRWLFLSGNRLHTLKNCFQGLEKLDHLSLNDNLIKNITLDALEEFVHLQELQLSHNFLTTLNLDLFKKLTNIIHIDLSFNVIHRINSSIPNARINKLPQAILDLTGNLLICNCSLINALRKFKANFEFLGSCVLPAQYSDSSLISLMQDGNLCIGLTTDQKKLLPPSPSSSPSISSSISLRKTNSITTTQVVTITQFCNQIFCHNQGVCVQQNGRNTCKCLPGYVGNKCEEKSEVVNPGSKFKNSSCNQRFCNYNGVCKYNSNSLICVCLNGYTGNNCEENSVQVSEKRIVFIVNIAWATGIVIVLLFVCLIKCYINKSRRITHFRLHESGDLPIFTMETFQD